MRSCVKLISAVTSQPETLCAYYLDLYYQVRSAYEREKAPPAAEPLTLEAAWPRLCELMEETLRSAAEDQARAILDGMGLLQAPKPDYPAPPRTMNTPGTPSTDGPSQPAAPTAPPEGEPRKPHSHPPTEKQLEALAEGREKAHATVDRSGGKNGAAMAKKEKLAIRDRLSDMRAKGLTIAEIEKAAKGIVTEGDLWKIMNGHAVGIGVYRDLDKVLDTLENGSSILSA